MLYNTRDKIHINLVNLVQLLLGSEIFCLLHGLVEDLSSFATSLLKGFVDGRGVLLEERQDNPGREIIRQSEKVFDADKLLGVDDRGSVIFHGSHAPHHEQTLAQPVERNLSK